MTGESGARTALRVHDHLDERVMPLDVAAAIENAVRRERAGKRCRIALLVVMIDLESEAVSRVELLDLSVVFTRQLRRGFLLLRVRPADQADDEPRNQNRHCSMPSHHASPSLFATPHRLFQPIARTRESAAFRFAI